MKKKPKDCLEDRTAISKGRIGPLMACLGDAIRQLCPPDWAFDSPIEVQSALLGDTARAAHLIDAIQDLGFHDDLLTCVPALLDVGVAQMETLYKDDCAGHEIEALVEQVLESLPRSSMSAPERILYADRLVQDDDYGLVPDVLPFLSNCSAADWQQAASRADLAIRPARRR